MEGSHRGPEAISPEKEGKPSLRAPVVSRDRRERLRKDHFHPERPPLVPFFGSGPHLGHFRNAHLRLVVLRPGDHPGHGGTLHHPGGRGARQGGMAAVSDAPGQVPAAGAFERPHCQRGRRQGPSGSPRGAGRGRQAHPPAHRRAHAGPGRQVSGLSDGEQMRAT